MGNDDSIFIWDRLGFSFSEDVDLNETIVLAMDFQTSASALLDDDRIGWMRQLSGDSDHIFGVQLDPTGNGGVDIEGYWDHIINVDEDKRPLIGTVSPGVLQANTYYCLRAAFTKLTENSVRIEVGLWTLDDRGNPVSELVSGSITDTSSLGNDAPDPAYFEPSTVWPAFKNYSGAGGHCDNAQLCITGS